MISPYRPTINKSVPVVPHPTSDDNELHQFNNDWFNPYFLTEIAVLLLDLQPEKVAWYTFTYRIGR